MEDNIVSFLWWLYGFNDTTRPIEVHVELDNVQFYWNHKSEAVAFIDVAFFAKLVKLGIRYQSFNQQVEPIYFFSLRNYIKFE